MEIKWEHNLPTSEKSYDYNYESPILIKNNLVYFLVPVFHNYHLHIVDSISGNCKRVSLYTDRTVIPKECFFLEYNDLIIIYAGDFFVYDGISVSKFTNITANTNIDYVLYKNHLLFSLHPSDSFSLSDSFLYCYNLDNFSLEWKSDISNTKRYSHGSLSVFQNTVACYGKDHLLFVDIDSGIVTDQIKIPRIDKLFSPIKIDNENILLGYTNWSNAGIVKYNTNLKKVIWRHKRKFEGPQLNCKIYRQENFVYWVKNETELICLNAENGDEVYRVRTDPWLYTDLLFVKECIIFGTSGRDGYLKSINAKNGTENWSVFLKNGCAYFDIADNSIFVGDFNKRIMQIDIDSGNISQELSIDGEVVGNISVSNNCVYTVIWGNSNKPVRLIKIMV